MDAAGASVEGVDPGSVRGRRGLRRGDRTLGGTFRLRASAAAEPHRRTGWPEALLADLSHRIRSWAAGRDPRLRLRWLSGLRRWLAVILHRGHGRARPVLPDDAEQHGAGGDFRAVSETEGRRGGSRVRLVAVVVLAFG